MGNISLFRKLLHLQKYKKYFKIISRAAHPGLNFISATECGISAGKEKQLEEGGGNGMACWARTQLAGWLRK